MTPDIINPNFIENGIKEGDKLDQSSINGFFNRVCNFLHGLHTKAAKQADVITGILVNIKRIAIRLSQAEFDITAMSDINLVGGIMAYCGTLRGDQTMRYMLCNGDPVPFSSRQKLNMQDDGEYGEYYQINTILWEMGKAQGRMEEAYKGEFDLDYKYHVPDLRGYFLVGSGSAVDDTTRTKAISLYKKGGEREVLLTGNQSGIQQHNHGIDRAQNSSAGTGGTFAMSEHGSGAGTSAGNVHNVDVKPALEAHPNMPPYFAINYYIRVLK
jgi:microcystin-dependent protein